MVCLNETSRYADISTMSTSVSVSREKSNPEIHIYLHKLGTDSMHSKCWSNLTSSMIVARLFGGYRVSPLHKVQARHVPFSGAAFLWRNACLHTRVRTSGIVHSSACVHICTFSSAGVGALLERN